MPLRRIAYGFTIRLPVPRSRAYRWAIDYQPGDLELMGLRATRRVERLAEDLILLTDSFSVDPFNVAPRARTVKVKLVHLLPRRYAWTSTHIAGPARYSQFIYELIPDGRRYSRLRYTGVQVERVKSPSTGKSIATRARTLRSEDYRGWRRFARAMAKDLA